MNPTTVFAIAWIVTAFLLACSLIGGYNIREEQRDEIDRQRAARKVAEAAYNAEARDHERTRQAWADERAGATPIYDQLAERRDSFDRTAAEIRALPTWEGRRR